MIQLRDTVEKYISGMQSRNTVGKIQLRGDAGIEVSFLVGAL